MPEALESRPPQGRLLQQTDNQALYTVVMMEERGPTPPAGDVQNVSPCYGTERRWQLDSSYLRVGQSASIRCRWPQTKSHVCVPYFCGW